MRPLNLIISGFGPYAGKVNIELDKLGRSGLYLITGDTGAGKTTIFDAIMFSLFGESSGGKREAKMFRSKYADISTKTFVELTFEYRGKVYVVNRNPDQEIKRDRGEGTKKEKADAVLTMPDGDVISGATKVTNKIVDILGVNGEQFSQVAMIAQGDFMKLIQKESKDRIEVFRKIFKTTYLQNIEGKIKDDYNNLYSEYLVNTQAFLQYLDGINDPSLQIYKDSKVYNKDVIALIENIIKKDTSLEHELETKKTNLEKEFINKNGILLKLKTYYEQKEKYDEALKNIKENTLLLPIKNEELEVANSRKEEAESYLSEATLLENSLDDYKEIETIENDIFKYQQQIVNLTIEQKRLTTEHNNLEELVKELKEENSKLVNVGVDKLKLNNEQEQLTKLIKNINQLIKAIENYNNECNELEKVQKEYLELQTKYNEAFNIYNENYQRFLDNQAGIMASNLVDGNPCPVCGAIHHPNKATYIGNVLTEAEVNALKEVAEEANRKMQDKSQSISVKVTNINNDCNNINIKLQEINYNLSLDKTNSLDIINQLKNDNQNNNLKLIEVNNKINEINNKETRKIELESLIPNKEKEMQDSLTNLNDTTNKLKENNALVIGKVENRDKIKNKLKYENIDIAKLKIKELLDTKEQILDDIKNKEEAVDNVKKNIELNEKVKESLEKTVQDIPSGDKENLEIEVSSLGKAKQDVNDEYINIKTNNNINKENLKEMEKLVVILDAETIKLQWLKQLRDTASGSIAGKDKLLFETYILTTYFDRIVRRANLRFLTMSNGQYEFARRLESTNKSKISGLDLDIIDHLNGTKRTCETLSGGESFMASLSLALGMSDEIASSSSIKLDTLFVDEGFGSLDEETLNKAYLALSQITEGERLVGIISHVEGLKDKIDRQIVVTKNGLSGSSVKII